MKSQLGMLALQGQHSSAEKNLPPRRNTLGSGANLPCKTWKSRKTKSFPLFAVAEFLLPPMPESRGGLSPSAVGVVEHILIIAAAFALIIAPFG